MDKNSRKRAIRRMHDQRMKRKAAKVRPHVEEPGLISDHLQGCSCYMCGNPRKHFGKKTMQEQKADLRQNDEDGYYE